MAAAGGDDARRSRADESTRTRAVPADTACSEDGEREEPLPPKATNAVAVAVVSPPSAIARAGREGRDEADAAASVEAARW